MPRQPVQPSTKTTKQDRRRERREEQLRQAAAQRRARRRRTVIGVIIGVVVVAVAIVSFAVFANRNAQSSTTATQSVPTTAPTSVPTNTDAQSSLAPAVDNVLCNSSEQLAYHIHAHLSIYINGKAVPVSEAIGINTSCIYWLHTHDTSGIIHIESPTQKTYTLGNFFDLWKQQFSQLQYPTQLDQSSGWQAYVNGKLYNGDFRTVPLQTHTLITLAYQSPGIKPDTVFNWGDL